MAVTLSTRRYRAAQALRRQVTVAWRFRFRCSSGIVNGCDPASSRRFVALPWMVPLVSAVTPPTPMEWSSDV